MSNALLELDGIHCGLGGLNVLAGIDLEIHPGNIIGLIGSNGAGKTTLLNIVHGFVHPHAGSIRLRGNDITTMPVHARAALGVGRVFQESRLWPEWTEEEHLSLFRQRSARRDFLRVLEVFSDSGEFSARSAGTLPMFRRRKLELAMAALTGSEILLIDEIGAGLNPDEARQLYADVKTLISREHCLAAIMVEHKLDLLTSHATELCFLQDGQVSGRVSCSDSASVSRLIGQTLAPAVKGAG